MLISKFFENKEIFITGGSGFIGKALIEKLLYSCTGVGCIYVLFRDKKGKSAQERLNDMLKTATFDRLREEVPEAFQKVKAIAGDCGQLGLGIKPEDLEKLKNVTIVYHSAASVRFDDELRNAILLNTRGTHEMIKVALNLPKLKAFIHVSTTYCNPFEHVVEEKIYPPSADWRTTIKLAETYDNETLNALNLKYSQFQPNTYTFTKSLAEQIVNEYRHQLPVIVIRPSIVISAITEPSRGWIDNFNGPMGMLVACGAGLMHTSYSDPNIVSDFVPVDIVVRALIIATYKLAALGMDCDKSVDKGAYVINCATATLCPLSLGQVIQMGKHIVLRNPFNKTIWMPSGSITKCWYWHYIRFLVYQIFLSILLDTALVVSKRKPILLKLQRRIYHASNALHYFMNTAWNFKNDKFMELEKLVPKAEFKRFSFLQYASLNYGVYLYDGIRGAKQFLLKESPDSSPGAKMRLRIFDILNFSFELSFFLLLLRFVIHFLYQKFY